MNLCIAHGHVEAFHYPLGLVIDEAHFAQERESSRMITEAELVRQAVAGLLIKDARKQFSKLVKQLNVTVVPKSDGLGNADVPLTEAQKQGPKRKRTLAEAVVPQSVPTPKSGEEG